MDATALGRSPSAQTIARLLTGGRDRLPGAETLTVAAIEGGVPQLVEAREVIAAYQGMIRRKALAELGPWLEQARSSLIASFVAGIGKDPEAVAAATGLPWPIGPTEGQITKLEPVKRMMEGPRQARPARSKAHGSRIALATKTATEPRLVLFCMGLGAAPPADFLRLAGESLTSPRS